MDFKSFIKVEVNLIKFQFLCFAVESLLEFECYEQPLEETLESLSRAFVKKQLIWISRETCRGWEIFKKSYIDPWLFWQHWSRWVVRRFPLETDWKMIFIKITAVLSSHLNGNRNCTLSSANDCWNITWISVYRCELNLTTRAMLFHSTIFHHRRRLFTRFDFQFMLKSNYWLEHWKRKSPRGSCIESSNLWNFVSWPNEVFRRKYC